MPTGLKVAIVFNLVMTLIVGAVALSVGSAPLPFAPDLRASVELKLVPIQSAREQVAAHDMKKQSQYAERIEIPLEFRTPNPNPSPWGILPDGTIRFTDRR